MALLLDDTGHAGVTRQSVNRGGARTAGTGLPLGRRTLPRLSSIASKGIGKGIGTGARIAGFRKMTVVHTGYFAKRQDGRLPCGPVIGPPASTMKYLQTHFELRQRRFSTDRE
jgi:hypothetical protein